MPYLSETRTFRFYRHFLDEPVFDGCPLIFCLQFFRLPKETFDVNGWMLLLKKEKVEGGAEEEEEEGRKMEEEEGEGGGH